MASEGILGQQMPIKPGEVAESMRRAAKGIELSVGKLRSNYLDPGVNMVVHDTFIATPVRVVEAASEDAKFVLAILPDIIEQFLDKNRKYAAVQDGYALGSAGIIPDLNRKLGILVDRLWSGNPTVGEDTDEVIGDLIGHLLLMLAKMKDE